VKPDFVGNEGLPVPLRKTLAEDRSREKHGLAGPGGAICRGDEDRDWGWSLWV
jgi:hypothetical protein